MTTDRDAILSIVSTLGGSVDGVGQRSTDALDRLLDTLAGSDITTSGNATVSDVISTIAQHASGMVKPEGAITITENGTGIDVAQYATADVSVSGGGASTQTLTVTKAAESDTVSVGVLSWENFIAQNFDATVEV